METGDIVEVLEQSGSKEVKHNGGCEVDVSESSENISYVIN
jgi:hypothetical protein